MHKLKVFIGWDSRETIAYEVLRASILNYNPNIEIIPLKRYELKEQGIYTREVDKQGTTEFTITRFLVPYLSNYEGYSLFMDCDMLLLDDVTKIMDEADLTCAVNCVKHNYDEIGMYLTDIKMDGKPQATYPRKNWSSVMLFNNRMCDALTLDAVNTASPAWLHRMYWSEGEIGELHHRWNYLAGYYHDGDMKNIHYTDGGPWFSEYKNCPHNELWTSMMKKHFGIGEGDLKLSEQS